MCLIILAWKARADLPLAVAANRDEWRDRPTEPAHWWKDPPDLLAGRDLEAGGTWMGITRGGRFAAVTNFRDPSERRTSARSRGVLVTEFLLGNDTPRGIVPAMVGNDLFALNRSGIESCGQRQLRQCRLCRQRAAGIAERGEPPQG